MFFLCRLLLYVTDEFGDAFTILRVDFVEMLDHTLLDILSATAQAS